MSNHVAQSSIPSPVPHTLFRRPKSSEDLSNLVTRRMPVRIPDRAGDWVFFVTFGKSQGEHTFDESITEDGVLSWQSQPAQRLAEELVVSYERDRLIHAGRKDLAGQVVHVSVVEGDGAGYDVRSFEVDGQLRHIEVKTTVGPANTAFFMSANELAFSSANAYSYFLYRIFDFDKRTSSAKTFILAGEIQKALQLTAMAYRAELK